MFSANRQEWHLPCLAFSRGWKPRGMPRVWRVPKSATGGGGAGGSLSSHTELALPYHTPWPFQKGATVEGAGQVFQGVEESSEGLRFELCFVRSAGGAFSDTQHTQPDFKVIPLSSPAPAPGRPRSPKGNSTRRKRGRGSICSALGQKLGIPHPNSQPSRWLNRSAGKPGAACRGADPKAATQTRWVGLGRWQTVLLGGGGSGQITGCPRKAPDGRAASPLGSGALGGAPNPGPARVATQEKQKHRESSMYPHN